MTNINKRIIEGKLFTPFLFITIIIIMFLLTYKISEEYEEYKKTRKLITIPLKNYVIFPSQPLIKSKKKKAKQSNEDNAPDPVTVRDIYLAHVVSMIDAAKRYPPFEKQHNLEDTVKIKLSINSDGSIRYAKIITRSRYSGLNKEALASIYRAAPFPPFPALLKKDHITIIINIDFRLQ